VAEREYNPTSSLNACGGESMRLTLENNQANPAGNRQH
jgi:hypothetical protein